MENLIFITLIFIIAAIIDTIWLDYLRPPLALRYSWRTIQKKERATALTWLISLIFVLTLFWIGPAAISTILMSHGQ